MKELPKNINHNGRIISICTSCKSFPCFVEDDKWKKEYGIAKLTGNYSLPVCGGAYWEEKK